MSVGPGRSGGWDARWRDLEGNHHSKHFDRKRDAVEHVVKDTHNHVEAQVTR